MIDALGRPLDGGGPLACGDRSAPLDADPPPPLSRARVTAPIRTGVRVVDLFTPLCLGQRIGVFAGSGVGKSSLLAMLARAPQFDTVVIALVGERGREVREFLDDALGGSRASAVAVVSTGDESPMMRRLAPKTAMAVAEYFRDRGESVLLILDSVTSFAHAARDVALAAGEPAVARGYAPSVFSDLPRLLERAGPGAEGSGSITGIFSVLVDGDDHNDPVADAVRGTLDGHIVLDRAIADEGRYPAVNMLASVSRLAHPVWTPEQRKLVASLRSLIARYEETRELRLMGGYTPGADPILDKAIKVRAADLRGDAAVARRAAVRGSVHRTRGGVARRRQDGGGMSDTMIPPGPEIGLRAIGTALAGVLVAFAGYMLAYGGGKVRVIGMDHLAIFAQPRGPATAGVTDDRPVGGKQVVRRVGEFDADRQADAQPAAAPGQDRRRTPRPRLAEDRRRDPLGGPRRRGAGVGRIGAIVRRDGGWALVDDKGATLLDPRERGERRRAVLPQADLRIGPRLSAPSPRSGSASS